MKISIDLSSSPPAGFPYLADLNTLVLIGVSIITLLITYHRLRSDVGLQDRTARALKRLLRSQTSPYMPFRIIRHHVGGYEDNELRQHLVRAGAIRFADQNRVELWSLLSRIPSQHRHDVTKVVPPVSEATPSINLFPTAVAKSNDV